MSKKIKEKAVEEKNAAASIAMLAGKHGGQEKTPKTKDPTDSIRDTLNAIRGKFGDDAIMKLGEKPHVNVDAISTGSIGLDAALGVGGMPRGRIIEVFGPESSGKTTLTLHVIAEAQKKGGNRQNDRYPWQPRYHASPLRPLAAFGRPLEADDRTRERVLASPSLYPFCSITSKNRRHFSIAPFFGHFRPFSESPAFRKPTRSEMSDHTSRTMRVFIGGPSDWRSSGNRGAYFARRTRKQGVVVEQPA